MERYTLYLNGKRRVFTEEDLKEFNRRNRPVSGAGEVNEFCNQKGVRFMEVAKVIPGRNLLNKAVSCG